MIQLSHIFEKCTAGCKLSKLLNNFNLLVYMDDIKLFAKNVRELETLKETVRIQSQDRGMQQKTQDGSNQTTKPSNNLNAQGKRNLQILGNIGSWHHQISGNENEIKEEYVRGTRKLLETKLHSRNIIKRINNWAVPLVRYSKPFLKWTREQEN